MTFNIRDLSSTQQIILNDKEVKKVPFKEINVQVTNIRKPQPNLSLEDPPTAQKD